MDTQPSLFGDDYSFQAYIVERLEPLVPMFWESVALSFYDLRSRIENNDKHFVTLPTEGIAWFMHHEIARNAARIFRGVPGAKFVPGMYGTKRMNRVVVVGEPGVDEGREISVSLKKVCPRENTLLRSNTATRHQRKYWRRGRHLFDVGFKTLFGYELKDANTTFDTYLTYPLGRKSNAWVQFIPSQADVLARIQEEREAAAEAEREIETKRGFTVNPPKDRKDAAKDGERRAEGAG